MKKIDCNIKKTIKKRINLNQQKIGNVGIRNRIRRNDNKIKPVTVKLLTRNEIRLGLKKLNWETYPIDTYRNILNGEIKLVENFRVLFLISNYERKKMLRELLHSIKGFNSENITVDYFIIDDVSSYKLRDKNFHINAEHRGKLFYWKTFNEMFKYCKNNLYDIYVLTPNDFQKYDFNRIVEYGIKFKNIEYIFNIINDGREISWNNFTPVNITENIRLQFFTDCGFFTNYKTLASLNFKVYKIKHNVGKAGGSMVGSQLSNRLNNERIPIFTPIKSIAYHGHHDSLMHPEERKQNNLISQ